MSNNVRADGTWSSCPGVFRPVVQECVDGGDQESRLDICYLVEFDNPDVSAVSGSV